MPSSDDIVRALAAVAGLLAPVAGFVAWLFRRESARNDRILTVLDNHFQHDMATLTMIEQHMQQANQALAILVDRGKR